MASTGLMSMALAAFGGFAFYRERWPPIVDDGLDWVPLGNRIPTIFIKLTIITILTNYT